MQTLTYEWRRAKTIKTTWITAAFVIISLAALSFLTAAVLGSVEGAGVPASNVVDQTLIANPLVMVLVSSLGAMAFGHEYRYGTIRLTLTAFPKRGAVFWAKLAMTLLIALVTVALAVSLVYAGLVATGLDAAIPDALPLGDLAWHAAVFTATFALLAFAVTLITRSHPLGIVAPLLLFMVEALVLPLVGSRFPWLEKALPLSAMGRWFAGESVALSAGVWAAWMVGLLVLGFVLLKRRDA